MNFNTDNDTQMISFTVTHRTKEQLDHLYNELNRPVTHDELIVLLLQAYYASTAETAISIESQLRTQYFENEVSQASETRSDNNSVADKIPTERRQVLRRDYAYYRAPQVIISGRPQYTKHGVWYSPIEPRVSP